MRILHLATGVSGGAKRAAIQLQSAQSSSLGSAKLISNFRSVEEIKTSESMVSFLEVVSGKFGTVLQNFLTNDEYGVVSTFSKSTVSNKMILRSKPDLVHIHNWFNLLSMRQVTQLNKLVPVVFTMHDQRLLTGGCHSPLSCNQYRSDCRSCPAVKLGRNLVHKDKKRLDATWESMSAYGLISPSQWILAEALKLPIGTFAKVSAVIPNVIAPEYSSQKATKLKDPSRFRIIFIAANIETRIKGLDLLIGALNQITMDAEYFMRRIELTVLGEGEILENPKFNVSKLGRLEPSELVKELDSHDLCVVPSRLDNSPSVIIEANFRRLPVLATKVGGIPELIENNENGFLCDPNVESIKLGILNFLGLPQREVARIVDAAYERVQLSYGLDAILTQHLDVYRKLLDE